VEPLTNLRGASMTEYVTVIMMWGTLSGNPDIKVGRDPQNIIRAEKEHIESQRSKTKVIDLSI
jgi:hypothetical protein